MATFTEIWDQIRAAKEVFQALLEDGITSIAAGVDAYIGLGKGSQAPVGGQTMRGLRSSYTALFRTWFGALTPHLVQFKDHISAGTNEPGSDAYWEALADFMYGYTSPRQAPTVITKANPAVVTIAGHGFANGDEVYFVSGGDMVELTGTYATVANRTTDTFELSGVNSSAFTTYTTGGLVARAYSVNSRDVSFGSFAAQTGNVGNGQIRRITKDWRGHAIEAVDLGEIAAVCSLDATAGSPRGRERFDVAYRVVGEDILAEEGAGTTATLVGIDGDGNGIVNSSFQSLTGTEAAPTSIPGWETLDGSSADLAVSSSTFAFDSTNYYRQSPEERNGTPRSLIMKVTSKLRRQFRNVQRLTQDTPYVARVMWNRQIGSAEGTLTLRLGSETVSVVVAAQTGWQELILPLDENTWKQNWNTADAALWIEWTRTAGTLNIDGVSFAPATQFGNTFLVAHPGTTDWLVGDEYRATDALGGSEGELQVWLHRAYGRFVRAKTSGAETIAD